ncbi:hypothetical protein PENANT_c001G06973 [Penicillium antarcticum]|uniref:Uncharacterized protein n=1 Tax=Penicillium antarcticum TaxID=416450 RepID=A0A1V6QPM1_9EURO|nr:hypothetical protein PENANT_c001G06973 [Penicillium antarcticum]
MYFAMVQVTCRPPLGSVSQFAYPYKGVHRIVSAFASLLRGETIEPIEETRPSKIQFQAPKRGPVSPDPLSEQLYHASCQQWATGVSRMLLYGAAQWFYRVCSRGQRSLRTMHVASPILDRLDDLARKQKVHVTRHDLLMAMIAQATIKAFPGLSPTPIGFIYNFNHHLEKSAPLHNTFWPISIPLAQGIEMTHGDDQLIMLAIQIRHAVRAARSPECLELFRERYESMGPQQPLHPANLNPNRPNIQVSSSAHQDWSGDGLNIC